MELISTPFPSKFLSLWYKYSQQFLLKRPERGSISLGGTTQALCASPNIILVIKSRRMIWAEHLASMGDRFIECCVGETLWQEATLKT
jgi:hypothetical protein